MKFSNPAIRPLAALLSLIAVIMFVGVVAAPAQAAYADCPPYDSSGYQLVGCYYADSNGNGSMFYVRQTQGCINLPSSWNDRVSSARNRTVAGSSGAYMMRAWEDAWCSGASNETYAGPTNENFAWPWNDIITSYAVYYCPTSVEC